MVVCEATTVRAAFSARALYLTLVFRPPLLPCFLPCPCAGSIAPDARRFALGSLAALLRRRNRSTDRVALVSLHHASGRLDRPVRAELCAALAAARSRDTAEARRALARLRAACAACANVALRMQAAVTPTEQSARLSAELVARLTADAALAEEGAALVELQLSAGGGSFLGRTLAATVVNLYARGDGAALALAQTFIAAASARRGRVAAWHLRACALGHRWDELDNALAALRPTLFATSATRDAYASASLRAATLCAAARYSDRAVAIGESMASQPASAGWSKVEALLAARRAAQAGAVAIVVYRDAFPGGYREVERGLRAPLGGDLAVATAAFLRSRTRCVCAALQCVDALDREHRGALARWRRAQRDGSSALGAFPGADAPTARGRTLSAMARDRLSYRAGVEVPRPSVYFELQHALIEMRVAPTPPLAPTVATPVQRELSVVELADATASIPAPLRRGFDASRVIESKVSAGAEAPRSSAAQQGAFSACPPFSYGERGGARGGGFVRNQARACGPSLLELWGMSVAALAAKVNAMARAEQALPIFTTPLAPMPLSLFFFDTASSFDAYAETEEGRLLPAVAKHRSRGRGGHALTAPRTHEVPDTQLPPRPSNPLLPRRPAEAPALPHRPSTLSGRPSDSELDSGHWGAPLQPRQERRRAQRF